MSLNQTSDIRLPPKYWSLDIDLALANRFVASPLALAALDGGLVYFDLFGIIKKNINPFFC